MKIKQVLNLKIQNPETTMFEGPVHSITSYNEKGYFDILPQHTNFISIITQFIRFQKTDNTLRVLKISHGVVKVLENNVTILLGIIPNDPQPQTIS